MALTEKPEIPQEVLRHPGKFPVGRYLPEDLISKLPQIVKVEISQLTLKQSTNEDISEFTARLISFFNPKFEDDTEAELAAADVHSFASRCELTAEEFMLALSLATEGKLKSEMDKEGHSETIKLFREIDIIKLGEVKSAYIRHKMQDKQYENGKREISDYLNPPSTEPNPEEKQAQLIKFLKLEYARLQNQGAVMGTTVFYDLIRKEFQVVNLGFVEKFLINFKAEVFQNEDRNIDIHLAGSKKIIKKDTFLSFKDLFVAKYIEKKQLNELTEDAWIEYWQDLQEKQTNNF